MDGMVQPDEKIPLRALTRRARAVLGAALIAAGVTGLGFTFAPPAFAEPDGGDRHETMHQMMNAMHGEGTAERVHRIEGAEEMMDDCASMMSSMGSMMERNDMMDR